MLNRRSDVFVKLVSVTDDRPVAPCVLRYKIPPAITKYKGIVNPKNPSEASTI